MNKSELQNFSKAGLFLFARPGSTDAKSYEEVFDKKVYFQKGIKFDAYEGEAWIDLGGNAGAFSNYAVMKGAKKVLIY